MSNKDIRIGDKVRFLNDIGGGVVTRIEGKIIYVEDDIGFEVPMPKSEIVVVERTDESSSEHQKVGTNSTGSYNNQKPIEETPEDLDPEEDAEMDIEIRHDDNNPRIYLAFLDAGTKANSQYVDFYVVNDSNYHCLYLLVELGEDGLARELFNGRIMPNTKEYINTFDVKKLDVNWQMQVLLYRKNKAFRLFEPISESFKIKAHKFYREKSFKTNDFFDEKAVLLSVIKNELEKQIEDLTQQDTREILKEKGEFTTVKPKDKKKPAKPEILEVDLHIHELLDDTRGLSNSEILKIQMDRFNAVMEENLNNKGQKIIFIHGIVNGTLKHEVRRQLNTRYNKHNFQDASFREYGYGATMVII